MQKLTLEAAREMLKNLQYSKAQLGQLSTKEEKYKQALEMAIKWMEAGNE